MILNSCLYSCTVGHYRHTPKKHAFKNRFFWFALKNSEMESGALREIPLIGIEDFAPYTFSHTDHLDYQKGSLLENIKHFIKTHDDNISVKDFTVYTNLAFLGYVFNPINLILIELTNGERSAIIEIGNTFGEIKPYFVPPSFFTESGFIFTTQKLFYISPFIDHRNFLTFTYTEEVDSFSLDIQDYEIDGDGKKEIVLTTQLSAKKRELNTSSLIAQTIKNPFNTIYIIFFIHFHAFLLWMKKIKYFKKNELQEFQKGALKWKK